MAERYAGPLLVPFHAQGIERTQATRERCKVVDCQQQRLMFEYPRDERQMALDYVELVSQAHVVWPDVTDE